MKNLEEIKLNHEYKYRDLCRMFNEMEVDGNSRIAQFNRWSNHFEWHTKGKTTATRFIITKIYKPIKVQYVVEDQTFDSRSEAEEYAKSL